MDGEIRMIQCVLRWNNERLYKVELENGKSFTVGSGKNDTLFVEELLPGQLKFTYKKGALYASGKKLRDLYTEAIGEVRPCSGSPTSCR